MPANPTLNLLPAETAEAPAVRRDAPQEQPERPAEMPSAPENASSPRRRWVRRALFALLPLVLIAGAYCYVTGGRVMSTDDAYVNAETVGISTDISGIVKEIDVTENQHVDPGQVHLGHCEGDRRHGEPACRSWPGFVPPRSPSVPDRP